MPAAIAMVVLGSAPAAPPKLANITVYHVNPESYGGIREIPPFLAQHNGTSTSKDPQSNLGARGWGTLTLIIYIPQHRVCGDSALFRDPGNTHRTSRTIGWYSYACPRAHPLYLTVIFTRRMADTLLYPANAQTPPSRALVCIHKIAFNMDVGDVPGDLYFVLRSVV